MTINVDMGPEANAIMAENEAGAEELRPAADRAPAGSEVEDNSAQAPGAEAGVSKPGEEEVDERGVPIKNVRAEMERKLQESLAREAALTERLTKLSLTNQNKEETPPVVSKARELNVDELFPPEVFDDAKEFVNRILEAIDIKIEQKEVSYTEQAQQATAKAAKARQAAFEFLQKADENFSTPEFGKVLVKRPDGTYVVDGKSRLIELANEIKATDPSLHRRLDGDFLAISKAFARLKSGTGKQPQGQSAIDRVSTVQAGAKAVAAPSGTAGPFMDRDGNFLRECNEEEYFSLNERQRDAYDKWEVSIRV